MRTWRVGVLLFTLALPMCGDPAGPGGGDLALTGATVVDGTGAAPRPDHTIVIRDGRITEVVPDGSVELGDDLEVRDLSGRWVTPGFVDTHTHMPGVEDQDRFLRTLLAFGVTTSRSTAAAPSGGVELRDRIESGAQLGPRFRTSGRLIDAPGTVFPDFGVVVTSEEEIRAEVRRQAGQGVDLIKLYSLLTPDLVRAAVDEAHAAGLPVVGHLGRTTWTEAVAAGIDELTHSCHWGMAHSLVPAADSADFFTPGPGFDPGRFADWSARFSLQDPRVEAFLDAVVAGGVIAEAHRRGAWITAGSDTRNPWMTPGIAFHRELELLEGAGIPTADVLRIATRNGAASLGVLDETGTVTPGKAADLVVLTADPLAGIANTKAIELVIVRGRVLRPAELLQG